MRIGKQHVFVWEEQAGEIHEDDCARRMAAMAPVEGAHYTEPAEGKVLLISAQRGLFRVNRRLLNQINSIGDVSSTTMGGFERECTDAELGGATLTVFAAITMSGIELLNEQKMSYRNKMIVGVALAIGVGIASKPEIQQFLPQLAQNILGSSLMVSFLAGFLLNILIPDDEEEVKTRLPL